MSCRRIMPISTIKFDSKREKNSIGNMWILSVQNFHLLYIQYKQLQEVMTVQMHCYMKAISKKQIINRDITLHRGALCIFLHFCKNTPHWKIFLTNDEIQIFMVSFYRPSGSSVFTLRSWLRKTKEAPKFASSCAIQFHRKHCCGSSAQEVCVQWQTY
jgi:hypothetical protein